MASSNYEPNLNGLHGHLRELGPAFGDGAVDMVSLVALLYSVTIAIRFQGAIPVDVFASYPPVMISVLI